MTLVARDEADVIAWNIRHHLTHGASHMSVALHDVTDGSQDVVRELQQEGLPLTVIEVTGEFRQSEWCGAMAAEAYAMGATWVAHTDADEFWLTSSPGVSLSEVLDQQTPGCSGLLVPRHNYVFVEDALSSGPFFERMVFRQTVSINPGGWPLPGKVVHRAGPSVALRMGNHRYDPGWDRCSAAIGLEIHHFQFRSLEQFERKVSYFEWWDQQSGTGMRKRWRRALADGQLQREFRSISLQRDAVDQNVERGALTVDTRLRDRLTVL